MVDDFDVTYPSQTEGAAVVSPADDPRNKRKVEEIIKKCPITVSRSRPSRQGRIGLIRGVT